MNDLSQLCKNLQAGASIGATGYDLLRWASKKETVAKVLENPLLQSSRDNVRNIARGFRGTEIPVLPFRLFKLFDTVGDRISYENQYFLRRKILLVSALSVWLWNDPEDIVVLEDIIWALCDDYTWSLPAHMHGASLSLQKEVISYGGPSAPKTSETATTLDLFACETGLALAEICALIGDRIDPFIVERARSEVMRRVVDSYMHKATIQSWEIMDNNWCMVCAGSIGSAAMLLVEHELDLAAILRNLIPVVERFLDGFSEGACTEGLAYWTYGISFFVVFAEFLGRRTAGKFDLLSDDRVSAIAEFQQHCFFPGSATLTFSDSEANAKFRPGLTCLLAERFQNVSVPPLESCMDVTSLNCYHFAPALFDMLWTTGTLLSKQKRSSSCKVYEQAQWILCSGYNETGFAAKGGHNDETHNHNDVGSFIFSKYGVMFLCDIGYGLYTKSYFGPGRYDIFCNSSKSHNVPIIDGLLQGTGRKYRARNVIVDPKGKISLDIAPAYPTTWLTALQRSISFDKKTGQLTLRDKFKVSRPVKIIERFVSFVRPQIESGILRFEHGHVSCTLLSNPALEPLINRTEHIDHVGTSIDVYTIDFHLNAEDSLIFELVIF